MSQRTVILSSFEEYLASENYSPDVRAQEERERKGRLSRFPYAVTLQVAYPELDFANRWCWQHFGFSDGECLGYDGDYPVCSIPERHSHQGKWMWCWLGKTDYNFGFCEWYFSEQSDRDYFLASVDGINWGEKYA
jgi:hypothetical protein